MYKSSTSDSSKSRNGKGAWLKQLQRLGLCRKSPVQLKSFFHSMECTFWAKRYGVLMNESWVSQLLQEKSSDFARIHPKLSMKWFKANCFFYRKSPRHQLSLPLCFSRSICWRPRPKAGGVDADSSGSDLPLGFNSRGIPKWRVMEMERLRFVGVVFFLEASLIWRY